LPYSLPTSLVTIAIAHILAVAIAVAVPVAIAVPVAVAIAGNGTPLSSLPSPSLLPLPSAHHHLPAFIYAFFGGKKTSSLFFGHNIARDKICPKG
jgi:hypothetical protein